jgi:PAS domain S-box-containing protein
MSIHDSLPGAVRETSAVEPASRGPVAILLILLIFAGGIAGSVYGFQLMARWHEDRVGFAFTQNAEDVALSIERSIQRNFDAAYALGAFVAATEGRLGWQEFRRFAEPLLARNPAIRAMAWVPRVPGHERSAFEAAARQDFPGFQITERVEQGYMERADEWDEYLPVRYIAPLEANKTALGFDAASSAVRRQSLRLARDTGVPAATAPVMLIPTEGLEPAQLVYYPIYRGSGVPQDVEQRREQLLGYAAAALPIIDTVETSLGYLGDRQLDLYLYDRTAGEELLYHRPAGGNGSAARQDLPPPADGLRFERSFDTAGRVWTLILSPAPGAFPLVAPIAAWAVLAIGLAFTLGLVVYLTTLRIYALRAQRLVAALQQEVDERTQIQREFKRKSQYLSTVLDTVGALVIVLDRERRVQGFNRAAEAVTGYRFEEVRGQRMDERLLTPEGAEALREAYELLLTTGRSTRGDSYVVAKDGGQRLITWSYSVLRDSHGEVEQVIANGMDVTDRRRGEEAEMAHVLRLSTLSELAAGIAHELNQPLGAISNYAQGSLLRLQRGACEQVAHGLQEIIEQSQRASQIINHLRHLTRKEAPDRTAVDVNEAVAAVARILRGEILRRKVEVYLHLDERLPLVLAARVQIEQVVLNLARNAVEAMCEHDTKQRILRIETAVQGQMIQVSVCDTGPGVAEEARESVFQRFNTSKRDGMGMGLAISRSIVQSHGGRIWVEPNPGGGSCFRFTLPIAPPNEGAA